MAKVGSAEIEVELGTKGFEKQIARIERQLNDYISDLETLSQEESFDEQSQEVLKLEENIEKLNNQLTQLKQKQDDIDKSGYKNVKESIQNIGASTENVIKKVARWGLAIFSIRSAYMLVRQAVSSLSQYDEKIGADIQYIRFALATALKPIIETIIQLVYKLLAYIGYIAKAWFGVNLFANASAKAFQKVNKGVKDTNKSAKQLSKTLAGFDEMNILQDNGNVSSGGGGGGVGLPTQDLSDLSKVEIPKWLETLVNNGELIKNIIIGIGEAFLTWKLVKWASELGVFTGNVSALATMLKVAGIVAIVVGITGAIQDIIKFIGDPTWYNFYSIVEDLSVALLGLSAILIGINASNPFGWITLAISATGLLISALGKEENSTLSVKEANEQLKQAQDNLNKATNNYTNALNKNSKMKKELADAEKKAKQTGKELYNQVILGIVSFDDMTDTQKELYGKYLDSLQAEEDLRQKTIELQQANDKVTVGEQKKASAIYASTGKYNDYFNALVKGFEDGKISSQRMREAVTNIMTNLDKDTRKTFAENLPQSIKDGFQKTLDEMGRTELKIKNVSSGITISYKEIASSTKQTFEKNVPNSVQKSIDKVKKLSSALGDLAKKGAVSIVAKVSSVAGSKNAKGAIYYPPKLAVGGIINQPGRGVPLAMGGERGAEGVIPLTDAQQMQRLGEAIGKYINVTAILNNYMNSRLISREVKQVQNEEEFAYNGG